MQAMPSLFLQAFVAGMTLVVVGCSSDERPGIAEEGNVTPPADLVEVSGELARALLAYDPPEDSALRARAGGRVLAVVFRENPAEIPPLIERLRVGEVAGCSPDGAVTCCNPATGTLVVNTTDGWLGVGESCEPDEVEDGDTEIDDPDEPGVSFIPVEQSVSLELWRRLGINYLFMPLAERDGTARVLVNEAFRSSDMSSSPQLERSDPQAGLRTIPASHEATTPPGGCVSTVSYCRSYDSKKCRRDWLHKYYKDRNTSEWCEMPDECRC